LPDSDPFLFISHSPRMKAVITAAAEAESD
jgi:hypothetical protein